MMGEGVFQRITLSLPRDDEIPKFESLYSLAKANLLCDATMNEVRNGLFPSICTSSSCVSFFKPSLIFN